MSSTALFSRKNVIDNALTLTTGSALAQGLMALAMLVVARQLGATLFGEYAASFSATALLSVAFNLGLDTWLLRAGTQHRERLGGLLRVALTIKLAAGIPWIVSMVILLPALNSATFRLSVALTVALAVWLEGLFSLGLTVFRVLLRNRTTALLMLASRGGVLILTIALTFVQIRAVLPYAMIRLVVSAGLVWIVWRLIPVKLAKETVPTALKVGKASLTFALSDLFAAAYVQADVTIAAVVLGKEAVGLYSPASSIISALFVVPTALYYVCVPTLTDALGGEMTRLRRLIYGTLPIFVAVGSALCLGAWLLAGFLPYILGASFSKSSELLAILSPILLLKGFSFGAASILVAVGWQAPRAIIQAVAALLNVALNLVVVTIFGITGVAVAYVVSELFLAAGYLFLVARWRRAFLTRASTGAGHAA